MRGRARSAGAQGLPLAVPEHVIQLVVADGKPRLEIFRRRTVLLLLLLCRGWLLVLLLG